MSHPEPETYAERVELALREAGGPPEIAEQLIALAMAHGLDYEWSGTRKGEKGNNVLLEWIGYHIGEEWSALQFDQWAKKFKVTLERLNQGT